VIERPRKKKKHIPETLAGQPVPLMSEILNGNQRASRTQTSPGNALYEYGTSKPAESESRTEDRAVISVVNDKSPDNTPQLPDRVTISVSESDILKMASAKTSNETSGMLNITISNLFR
jgi:hypothetical protein